MTALLFAPHSDDETLFAGLLAQQHQAHIVVVLRSQLQEDRGLGITGQQRERETDCAVQQLGLTWQQWPYLDAAPDWDAVEVAMRAINDRLEPAVVLAPAVEPGGHEQHTKIGHLAAKVFVASRLVPYLTYRRGHGRTVGHPVVFTPDQLSRKLRALACYRSQMSVETGCLDWFVAGQQEYTA